MSYVKQFMSTQKTGMDAEGKLPVSDIDDTLQLADHEMADFDREEMAIAKLGEAAQIHDIKSTMDGESDDYAVANMEYQKAITAAVTLEPGLAQIIAMDGEGEKLDATKAFLKTVAKQAGLALERLLAIAKKLFLKASAWIAASDSKKKELEKELKKIADDISNKQLKVGFTSNDNQDKIDTFIKNHKSTLEMMCAKKYAETAYKVTDAVINAVATEAVPKPDKTEVQKLVDGKEAEGTNSLTDNILKDSGTKYNLAGFDTKFIYVLAYNDNFKDPDDEDATESEVVFAVVKYDTEEEMLGTDDANVKTLLADITADKGVVDGIVSMLSELPKSQKLRDNIDKSFKIMEGVKKEADKEFGKKPEEWTGKAKKAQALKASFQAKSKNAYLQGKTAIALYRATLDYARIIKDNFEKKKA